MSSPCSVFDVVFVGINKTCTSIDIFIARLSLSYLRFYIYDIIFWISLSAFKAEMSYISNNTMQSFAGIMHIYSPYFSFMALQCNLQPRLLLRHKLHWRDINWKLRDIKIYNVLRNCVIVILKDVEFILRFQMWKLLVNHIHNAFLSLKKQLAKQ